MAKYFSRRLACLSKRAWDSFRPPGLDCDNHTSLDSVFAHSLLPNHPSRFNEQEYANQPAQEEDGAGVGMTQGKELGGERVVGAEGEDVDEGNPPKE